MNVHRYITSSLLYMLKEAPRENRESPVPFSSLKAFLHDNCFSTALSLTALRP